jgi:glycosyltransferase involved in cell wall biosynthesis
MVQGKKIGIAISSYICTMECLRILKSCLASLLQTSTLIDKIILIDDCSTLTETFDLYDQLKNNRLTIIRNSINKGISSVKNQSLLFLKDYDIIILSDCDNYFYKNWDFFYIHNFLRTNIKNVNNSNIFNTDNPIKKYTINDIEIGVHQKFQGNFIVIDKDILDNVGGFPLLPEKYGLEHYNWQTRINMFLKRENYSYDFIGGNNFIKNNHTNITFANKLTKDEMSLRNKKASDYILENKIIKLELRMGNITDEIIKNCCIIIPHRVSTLDREDNLRTIINFYNKLYKSIEIILVEEDIETKTKFNNDPRIKYIFAYNKYGFNRSWAFNIGAKRTKKDILICLDNDVILEKEGLEKCVSDILDYNVDFCTPYEIFWNINKEETDLFKNCFNFNILKNLKKRYSEGNVNQYGGSIICRKESFLSIGGFNEIFRGWGGEDDEFVYRIKKVEAIKFYKLYNYKLLHLFHNKTLDCTSQQPFYQNNVDTLTKISRMDSKEILSLCEELKKDFGNLDKYIGEH